MDKPLHRQILGEWVVLFRDEQGRACALQDRCTHRNFQLSKGAVKNGCLRCPYHGWTYNSQGSVVEIPAEGPEQKLIKSRKAKAFEVMEQDDLIYVRLEKSDQLDVPPFSMPHYKEKGFKTIRLFNIFKNNVTNCAENYVDVPHTVFVHDKIFRVPKQELVEASVVREQGKVVIDYKKETNNLGWFSWFLNPTKAEIKHTDSFIMPNTTSVEYVFGPKRVFTITSHCTPVSEKETHVITDLTFDFGIWNLLAAPIVKYQGQKVIDQDLVVLENQMKVIEKYGTQFANSKADIVHVLIESIREEITKGQDPRDLPKKEHDFKFWI